MLVGKEWRVAGVHRFMPGEATLSPALSVETNGVSLPLYTHLVCVSPRCCAIIFLCIVLIQQ